jgi:hypothetical protein
MITAKMTMKSTALFLTCLLVCSPLSAQNSGWNGYQSLGQPNGTAAAPLSADTEESRFYLLKTGFLTEGTATNDGKQYALKTNFGTMHIPVANVEFVGRTREDVYNYKKGFIDEKNCNDLMKFAEWCFNNNLQQQGIAEYQRALRVAPNAVLAEVIRKRLETTQDSKFESVELSSIQMGQNTSGESTDAGLSRWINGVPKSVIDSFSKKVQPVLVSRCAAADCHGSNSENQFKLNIPSHTVGNTTYRNMRSAVQWIDLDYPTESQLLSALVTYHGGTKPAFNVESSQYNNVVQWVRLASKELPNELRSQLAGQKDKPRSAERESVSPSIENSLPPTLQNVMIVGLPTAERQGKDHPKEVPATFLPPITNSNAVTAEMNTVNTAIPANYLQTGLNVPNPPQAEPQKDPFDPGIFNARHHGAVEPSKIK